MKVRYFCFLSLGVSLSISNACPAKANGQYGYDQNVELTGKIELRSYSSQQPPYFGEGKSPTGETAPNVCILVFVPDTPIDVIATAHSGPEQDSFYDVKALEIDVLDDDVSRKYLGMHVNIFGFLSERQTGFEYTDVLITENKIRGLGS